MIDNFLLSLIAGTFVGIASAYIGSLMVLKKMALVGDALSHVALPGLALGILFSFNPFIGAFAFLFIAALVTGYLEKITRLSVETIVGALFTFSLAVGILIMPEAELLEALFGDIAKIDFIDAVSAITVSILAIVMTRIVYKTVVLGAISEDLAISTGVKVNRENLIYLLLVSLVVAVGIKFAGTLLVGALVVVPPAAAKIISSNQRTYALLSSVFGAFSSFLGIMLSNYLSLPAGAMAVLVGIAIFVVTVLIRQSSK